jgi:alanine racemase
MSLDLYVDGPRWRAHLRAAADANPGVVPVAKGNGYGFGLAGLARRTQWLGCDTIAVGTYREVGEVRSRFHGDILVLEPWRPFAADVAYGPRVIHTVGRIADLTALGSRDDRPRVVLEGLTSMRRHGFPVADLLAASAAARGVRVEGHALHLPLGEGHLSEVESWLATAPARRWYLSHVTRDELTQLTRSHPDLELRPRIGTELWLGDRNALSARATVLDAHPVKRGDRVGYRRRKIVRSGTLLVVSGGTAHGIGLEGPSAAASPRHRARSLAKGGLDAAGLTLSPYIVGGRQRWFVEPPHMQVSMVHLPPGDVVPEVGDEVEVQVRFTTTTFDHVHLS